MAIKTYAVVGATGHVGGAVAERLKALGHRVRKISRSYGVDIDDAAALKWALRGADGAFLMLPPEHKAARLRERQDEIGAKYEEALKSSRPRRVVFLSSLGAQWNEGTGPVLGLHDMEARLNGLGIAELIHIRAAYFMENHLNGLERLARTGVLGGALRPDLPVPMIAAGDIGEKAAEWLVEEPFKEPRIRELLGPRDYEMKEVASVLGSAIGHEDLRYEQLPLEEARRALLAAGFSQNCADAMAELDRAINEGRLQPAEERSPRNTTPTSLGQFARMIFRRAYDGVLAVAR